MIVHKWEPPFGLAGLPGQAGNERGEYPKKAMQKQVNGAAGAACVIVSAIRYILQE
jgi:hypothetical protein